MAKQLDTVAGVLSAQNHTPAVMATLAQVRQSLQRDVSRLSAAPTGDKPVTLGIGEPFTTTVTVSLIFALILSLPVLLLQAYGFLMPAFDPSRRRRMLPVTVAIPVLFAVGVAFGYEVVLPAALHFFQNFNSSEFNVLVQASQYYKFAATTLLAMGLLFQIPVAVIAVTRAGVVAQRTAPAQPSLRAPRVRLRCRCLARRRDHDAARDAAALPAVRGQRTRRVDRRPSPAGPSSSRSQPRERRGRTGPLAPRRRF